MKKQLLWAFCLIMIGLISCKSNTNDLIIQKHNCLLAGNLVTNEDGSISKNIYLYDLQNRRIQDTYINSSSTRFNYTTKYEYSNKAIKSTYVDGDGYTSKTEYTLDNNGYALSYKSTGGYGSVNTVFLKYDNNGYLIELTSDNDKNHIVKFTYTNGNNTEISTFDRGIQTEIIKLSFDTNIINTDNGVSNSYFSDLFKSDLFGKYNKNIMKQLQSYDQSGKLIVNKLFSYTFDSQGVMVQQIEKNANGSIHAKNDYTYQCQ